MCMDWMQDIEKNIKQQEVAFKRLLVPDNDFRAAIRRKNSIKPPAGLIVRNLEETKENAYIRMDRKK